MAAGGEKGDMWLNTIKSAETPASLDLAPPPSPMAAGGEQDDTWSLDVEASPDPYRELGILDNSPLSPKRKISGDPSEDDCDGSPTNKTPKKDVESPVLPIEKRNLDATGAEGDNPDSRKVRKPVDQFHSSESSLEFAKADSPKAPLKSAKQQERIKRRNEHSENDTAPQVMVNDLAVPQSKAEKTKKELSSDDEKFVASIKSEGPSVVRGRLAPTSDRLAPPSTFDNVNQMPEPAPLEVRPVPRSPDKSVTGRSPLDETQTTELSVRRSPRKHTKSRSLKSPKAKAENPQKGQTTSESSLPVAQTNTGEANVGSSQKGQIATSNVQVSQASSLVPSREVLEETNLQLPTPPVTAPRTIKDGAQTNNPPGETAEVSGATSGTAGKQDDAERKSFAH